MQNTFEGGTVGGTIDQTTSLVGGDAVKVSGGTAAFSATAGRGTRGCAITLASGQSYVYFDETATAARYVCAALIQCPPTPSNEGGLLSITASSAARTRILLPVNLRPRLAVGSSGVAATQAPTGKELVPGTWYLMQLAWSPDPGGTTGTAQFRISDTAGNLFYECPIQNHALTTGAIAYRYGTGTTGNGWTTQNVDDIQGQPLSSGWLAPLVDSNALPIANAGTNRADIEPGTLVTTGGTDTDADGTIASRSWVPISGPAVTLSSTTGTTTSFVAPATRDGGSVVLRKTVTDDQGATGTADVTIAVLPASRWTRTSSGMQPTYRMTTV